MNVPTRDWDQIPESPRRRRPPSRGRNPGKGKGTQKGKVPDKGKGKGKAPQSTEAWTTTPPGPAPSMALLPGAPSAPPVNMPKGGAMPDSAITEEMKLLQALAPHVEQLEHLPTSLRDQLSSLAGVNYRQESKALHSLVQRRTKAKTEVHKIRRDRAQFESAWMSYISQLKDLLQKQFKQRTETLDAFVAAETSWMATLKETVDALQKANVEDQSSIPIDSDMEDDPKDDVAAAYAASAAANNRGQQQLLAALSQMHETAQQGAKRDGSRTPRRRADGQDNQDGGPHSSPDPWSKPSKVAKRTEAQQDVKEPTKAMQPFPKPQT